MPEIQENPRQHEMIDTINQHAVALSSVMQTVAELSRFVGMSFAISAKERTSR